jgi:hypothetical protein
MNKVLRVAVASAFVFAAIAPNTASAVVPPPPVIHPFNPVTTSTAGAAATTGFIAFVAFLAAYDFVRRTNCIGDPLGLGGPGFSEPMPATGSIIPPRCPLFKGKGKH